MLERLRVEACAKQAISLADAAPATQIGAARANHEDTEERKTGRHFRDAGHRQSLRASVGPRRFGLHDTSYGNVARSVGATTRPPYYPTHAPTHAPPHAPPPQRAGHLVVLGDAR